VVIVSRFYAAAGCRSREAHSIADLDAEPIIDADDGGTAPMATGVAGDQRIQFATGRDGTRIAYATHGAGPPLVRAAHWLTHLQYDWESPIWRPWLTELGRRFTMIRYDERGCGLSDWHATDFSLDAWVEDLEAVTDAARLDRFALLGMSQGAAVAIAYAVRHPERVSHLVLFGGYLQGWRRRERDELRIQEHEAVVTLMRLAWGRDNPIFRRLVTQGFVPDGDEDLVRAYDELMRRTTSPENAARFEDAFGNLDVADLAPRVAVPTLVMHLDDDQQIPFWAGRAMAAAIPNARFVQLEGRNHVLRPDEPAWPRFLETIADFVAAPVPPPDSAPTLRDSLTARELEVLRFVALGRTNQEIASELDLSVRTVERHLSNVYVKLDVSGKAGRAAAAARLGMLRAAGRDPS
jgi:pimeloyl-ACP methyl ester carboxylesterase/DNA-binding CsgD family transcriptional regulator